MRRRLLALFTVMIIVITCFQGCSSNKDKTNDQVNGQDVEQKDGKANQNNDESVDNETVMGRFMEKKIDLPEFEDGEIAIKILQNADHQIELYTQLKGEYRCYLLQNDMTWESSDATWLKAIPYYNNVEITSICYGEDGNYYLCYVDYDQDGKCHIIKSEDGGNSATELMLSYLQEKVTNGDYQFYPMIQGMEVTKNGDLILYELQSDNELLIFALKEDEPDKLKITSSDQQEAYFKVVGNDIITLSEDNKNVIVYNTESKTTVKSVACNDVDGSKAFAIESNGTVLMGNRNGIHRLAKDGTIWETTVDGALNSMSMPTLNFSDLYALEGDEEQYYATYRNNDGAYLLMYYVYDKNVSAVPSKEITVYSLKENRNIRQTISLFQTKNPDVKINYLVAMGDEEGAVADYIRALNTELLAGSGADVLVLDGLPVDSYIQKGVLADILDVIGPMESSGKLFMNIANSFHVDGKMYQIPIRFTIPILFGKSDALSAMTSIDHIVSYIKKSGEPFTAPETYRNLLQDYLALYSKDFFLNGKLSQDKFKTFLENVKLIADNVKATEFDENEENIENVENGYIPNDRLFRLKMMGLIKNEYSSAMCQFFNIGSTLVPLAVMKESNTDYKAINASFLPVGMVGLNSASKEAEIAKKFIMFLFSEEVQDGDLYDGFPINKNSLSKWMEKESTETFAFSSDGVMLDGVYPDKEVREGIINVIQEVNTPIVLNQEVINIMIHEVLPYLAGEIDLEQAAAAAATKINTYLAE